MNRAERRRQQKKEGKGAASATAPQPAGLSLEQTLSLALQHHAAGRLPNAERTYHQILQADPDHPVALQYLGVIAHQVGKHDIAVDLLTKALAVAPDYADAHNNLGNAFKALGRQDEAIASFHKAISAEPGFAEAHFNLGNEWKELGRLDDAVVSLQQALANKPNYADAYYNLGIVFKEMGRLDDAVASYQQAVSINPELVMAHNNLGNLLHALGRMDEAVSCYQAVLAIDPDVVETHYNIGNAFKDLGRLDEAITHFQKALAGNPHHGDAWNNLGNARQALGRLDEAVDSFRRAVAAKPELAEAHRQLANIRKFSESDNDVTAMENALGRAGGSDEQRMHLAFGLGKAHDDLGQFDKAFEYFSSANALKRATFDFSNDNVEAHFNNLKSLFTKDLFDQFHGAGSSDDTPVFILGMPRSGTSLFEQILAGHPQIHGAGELYDLQRVINGNFGPIGDAAFADNITQADIGRFSNSGDEYARAIRSGAIGERFITDKMPNNFQLIGMIKLMLPNAKIIHCRRDPLDTCLSIFKTLFTANGHFYAYDQSELGRYYGLYLDLMDHWRDVLPGFIFDVQYEDMIADQETQTRTILQYCGLDWNDSCLDFHKLDRPVYTASAAQVRRPIYKDAVQSSKHYEQWVQPLRNAL
jgi:tetratricopeptide (TPR) repeat protein